MSQRLMNVTEAKRDFLKIVRDVAAGDESIAIMRNGKPVAQLCPIESVEISESFSRSETIPKRRHREIGEPTHSAFGSLRKYADGYKRKKEKGAWKRAVEVKYGCNS